MRALHCVHERGVYQLYEFRLDEDVALLSLCSESEEPSEFSKVGGISAIATVSIGCGAFSLDLDPYDGLCIVGDPAVCAIAHWNSAE